MLLGKRRCFYNYIQYTYELLDALTDMDKKHSRDWIRKSSGIPLVPLNQGWVTEACCHCIRKGSLLFAV